jgi:hypothetical protein
MRLAGFALRAHPAMGASLDSSPSSIYIYYTSHGLSTWDNAEAYCRYLGGHLVTINDEHVKSAVHNLSVQFSLEDAWIGLKFHSTTGNSCKNSSVWI